MARLLLFIVKGNSCGLFVVIVSGLLLGRGENLFNNFEVSLSQMFASCWSILCFLLLFYVICHPFFFSLFSYPLLVSYSIQYFQWLSTRESTHRSDLSPLDAETVLNDSVLIGEVSKIDLALGEVMSEGHKEAGNCRTARRRT